MEEIQTLQQINVLGDTTLTGQINVTNDSNSTSFTSGSIVLAGGLGIAKDVFVNGISHTTNMHLLDASGTTVANQYFNGTTWKIENQVGNENKTLDIAQSAVTLNQTTPATSTVTGAITVVGGISTQDNVWARGNIVGTNTIMTSSMPSGAVSSVKNGIVFNSNSGLVNDNSGNLFVGVNTNHFGIRNNPTQGGVIKINTDASENSVFDFSTIASGSTGQTSLLTIDQNGSVKVASSTNSNSTTSGVLQVAGGMAVAKNVNVGGTLSLWDGANSGTINETSATLNISSTNINLTGNVQVNGNVQISGNVTLNGSSVSGSSSNSSSTSQSDSNILDDCILHTHIYNLENPSITKTMLTSSYSLKDYSTTSPVFLAPNGLYFYAVRLIQGQIVKGVFFWSNSTNPIIVRTGLYSADGILKVSLNENQTIIGNNMKYLPLTNSTWTVDATGIFYVGILGINNENDTGEGATGDFSLLFNRSSYGIAGTSYNGYSTGTIEIWVRNSGIVNDLQIIYGVRPKFILMFSSGNRLSTFDYGANQNRESNIYITDGNWHHIALTFELGTSNNKLYYDGVPVLTGFPMSAGTQTLTHLIVGRLSDITAAGFQGFCDNARIWNTVRSDAEILASYNRYISPNSTGLTGYWLFNEGTGTTSVNQVSGGQSFTFVNSPVWSAGSGTTNTNSIYLIATPTNAYVNYGQMPVTGKLSSTASWISSQTSMPATISGLTPTALTNLAYAGVYKDGV